MTHYYDAAAVKPRYAAHNTARNAAIVEGLRAGATLQTLGDRFGLTRQRVSQIWHDCATTDDVVARAVSLDARRLRFSRPSREDLSDLARARYVEAIREWHATFGEIPRATEWYRAAGCPRSRIDTRRANGDTWPWGAVGGRLFGSWNKAIRAAGFMPRDRGQHTGRVPYS